MKVAAGIDVGKAQLDVSVAAGAVRRFANSAAIGLSAAGVAWCAAPSISPPYPPCAMTAPYIASTKVCASAVSQAKSP